MTRPTERPERIVEKPLRMVEKGRDQVAVAARVGAKPQSRVLE